jgi:hypothetical protein
MRAGAHVHDPGDMDELLKVPCDELWTIVTDDPRFIVRVLLQCPLLDSFNVVLGHRFPNLPMHDEPAVAIEQASQVVERATDIDVGDVHVPVLMGA